jgi:NADH:ubiquinone oxidoreductase subunit K
MKYCYYVNVNLTNVISCQFELFLVFSVLLDDMVSQSFASLVPTVTAAESAIRLAIFDITFRVRGNMVESELHKGLSISSPCMAY